MFQVQRDSPTYPREARPVRGPRWAGHRPQATHERLSSPLVTSAASILPSRTLSLIPTTLLSQLAGRRLITPANTAVLLLQTRPRSRSLFILLTPEPSTALAAQAPHSPAISRTISYRSTLRLHSLDTTIFAPSCCNSESLARRSRISRATFLRPRYHTRIHIRQHPHSAKHGYRNC